jgi:predicted XRE-type DNA-binding protein
MPRVKNKSKQIDYKINDTKAYLIGALKQNKIKQASIAEELGITQQGFSYRLREGTLTQKDLLVIFRRLETPDEKIVSLMTIR